MSYLTSFGRYAAAKLLDISLLLFVWPIWLLHVALSKTRSPRFSDDAVSVLATRTRRSAIAHHLIRVAILYLIISAAGPGSVLAPLTAEAQTDIPITIEASPSQTAVAGSTVTVTATVTELGGQGWDGQNVEIAVTGPGEITQQVQTDSSGRVTLTFNAPSVPASTLNTTTTATGTSNITFTTKSIHPEISTSTSVQWNPAERDHYQIDVSGPRHTDECFPVDISVSDEFGHLVSSDRDHTANVTSTFSPMTFFSDGACASSIGSSPSVTITSGEETVFARSGGDTGEGTFHAFGTTPTMISGASSPITLQGDPVSYTVEVATNTWTAGQGVSVTVTGFDENGEVVTTDSSTTVTMTSTNGSAQFDVDRDGTYGDSAGQLSNGVLVLMARGTDAGTMQLIATDANGETGTSEVITVQPGPPTTVSLEPKDDTNVVEQPHTVTATVTDDGGNPIEGVTVTLITSGSADPTPPTKTATSNEDGIVTFTFTSTKTGTTNITAEIEGDSDTATKTWVGGAPDDITLSPTNQTNGIGESQTVNADVRDKFGNPVADGTEVTFFAFGTGGERPSEETVTTTGGDATFRFTSVELGVSTVTAMADGKQSNNAVTFTWEPGPPAIIEVRPSDDSNQVETPHTVTATLKDVGGNPVDEPHLVTWTVTGVGATTTQNTSDNNSVATFTFTSTKTGTSTITAKSGIGQGTATKQWTPKPPETITLEPLTATNGVGEPHTVTATLRDEHGNPSGDGIPVTFTATGTGGEEPSNEVVNSSGGIAVFTFTSSKIGQSTITATAPSLPTSNPVQKEWTVGPPAEIAVSPSSAENIVGRDHTVTVTVTDQLENTVPDGTTVTFEAAGTGAEVPSSTETVTFNGVATFTFTSTKTGTSQIEARAGSALGTASKKWVPDAPFSLELTPQTASRFVGERHSVVATVRDLHGNLVGDGTIVFFEASGTDGETPSSGQVATSGGVATFHFTSSEEGTSDIVAEAAGTPPAFAEVDWIPRPPGYWLVASDGGIFAFGAAGFHGSTGAMQLNRPVVGMDGTSSGNGYWLVASDGGIFAFGDAGFHGSTGGMTLNRPVVGMAATPSGNGYWLVASDGGIFSFGDAGFHGSTGGMTLNRPVVGMAATPSGNGYWLVASDGGIFSFGDASFRGSTGGMTLNQPVVGMAATPSGDGYWLVASDGGIFSFGDASFRGSTGGMALNQPIVGMARTSSGNGYWLVARDGGIFSFGDASFEGSMGGSRLNQPVVGMAAF